VINANNMALMKSLVKIMYKVVQIWPGLFVCIQAGYSPGHIWTTLYLHRHSIRVKYEICETDKQAKRYGCYGIIYHPLIHINIGEI